MQVTPEVIEALIHYSKMSDSPLLKLNIEAGSIKPNAYMAKRALESLGINEDNERR